MNASRAALLRWIPAMGIALDADEPCIRQRDGRDGTVFPLWAVLECPSLLQGDFEPWKNECDPCPPPWWAAKAGQHRAATSPSLGACSRPSLHANTVFGGSRALLHEYLFQF